MKKKKVGYVETQKSKSYKELVKSCEDEVNKVSNDLLEATRIELITKLKADRSTYNLIFAFLAIVIAVASAYEMPAPFNISPGIYWGVITLIAFVIVLFSRKRISLRYTLIEFQIELIQKKIEKRDLKKSNNNGIILFRVMLFIML